ncbi:Uncharacterised protein [Mycolicibacterium vanbaalenii]|uniref:Uncharacterized protein n=1 Tax=Mycolicibacterium vanbaalenii TaxID=110539 RepID=A0A5S9PRJ8_MYCVN|nr:hypothetical protein [Mycolicibacterium vanbaalenii]CAA0106872.1 Uncharacterised protein [Mycolicibacterium vanbaalenii]
MPQALDGGPSEPAVHAEQPGDEPAEAEPSPSRPGTLPGVSGRPIDLLRAAPTAGALP